MNGEEIAKITAAVGKEVTSALASFKEDAFIPMRDDVKAIRKDQKEHGERLAGLEVEVKNKGNCTTNTANIKANKEKAKGVTDIASANRRHINYLTVSLLVAVVGLLGAVVVFIVI